MNILIVFPHNPFLKQNGVQVRFFELLKYFQHKKIDVDLLSHTNFMDTWDIYDETLARNIYLNDFSKYKSNFLRIKRKLLKLFNKRMDSYLYDDLIKHFKDIVIKKEYDYVLISYVYWANLLKYIDTEKTQTIITIEDFISMNNYERQNGNYNLGRSINEEIERINLFDKAICISKDEMNFFERVCKDVEFQHIPHFLERKFNEHEQQNNDILFVGSDNPFNKDGMIWFFEKVMPYLNKKFKIRIVGRVNEHLDRYKKKYTNIEFISYVENLDDIYKETKITICPLQAGTGLKIKVVESLSFGLPVVTTKYGVVGMDVRYNGCIVVDEAKEFASSIELLLNNEEKYIKYRKEAQGYFVDNFSKESVYKKLDKVFVDE